MTGPPGLNVKVVRNYSLQGRMGGSGAQLAGYANYTKFAQIQQPGPSVATTFVDESINSIDDGFFSTQNRILFQWKNPPTARHNNSGTFAFADGHAESWKWLRLAREMERATMAKSEGEQRDWAKLLLSVVPVIPNSP